MMLPMSGIWQGRMRGLRGLFRDRKAAVSVLGALALPSVIGASALAVELGAGYNARVENQRVADLAALAAATALAAKYDTTTIVPSAQAIGAAAGISDVAASYEVVDANTWRIKVVVATSVPVRLASLVYSGARYTVRSVSYAKVIKGVPAGGNGGSGGTSQSGPCFFGTGSGSAGGISLTGGTSISAASCSVFTNGSLSLTSGTTLNVTNVTTAGTVTDTAAQWGTPGIKKTGTITQGAAVREDPLANNQAVNAALAKLGNYTAPVIPTVQTGADLNPQWYPTTLSHSGYNATWNSSTSTYTFPPGTYRIKNINNQGGMKLVFTGPTDVTVSGTINVGGGIAIGDGPVTFSQAFTVNGTVTMGAGNHAFGGNITLGGGATFVLGAGNVDIAGGIDQSGGGTITFGNGNYAIGKLSSGNAINQGGGAKLTFGNGPFSANGNIVTAGGTSLVFGQSAYHYINGNMNLSGGATLGSGFYIINGNFTNGTGGYMSGNAITLILAGTMQMSGGTSLALYAPSATSTWGIPQILVATKSTAATTFSGGSNNLYSGVFYTPNSAVTLSGGAALGSPQASTGLTDPCLMFIFKKLNLDGGTTAASYCSAIATMSTDTGSGTAGTGTGLVSLDQ